MSLDQPDRVGQQHGGRRVDAGLTPDRVDEPGAQFLKGRAIGTGEQEGSDQIHLGGADVRIEPKLSSLLDAERACEGHEPGLPMNM